MPGQAVSAWSPLGSRSFALLWSATLVSNTGTWMHDVGAGWLMTTLSPSPAIVSLVQAATTLPIFLFALLAGAIADRVNKRSMLLTVNVLLLFVVSTLALLVQQERMTPALLLLFTLAIGTGTAFMAPAWQAVVPSLVPKPQLKAAVALNSLSINISRAIGPAIAGVLITTQGLVAPFIVNALSFVAAIAALLCWRQTLTAEPSALPPERVVPAMMTGLRHVRYNPPLIDTIIRAAGFFFFAAAYWALLPVIVKEVPGAGADLYGHLMAAIGTGAVTGALLLPKLRASVSSDWLVLSGSIGTALAMLSYAWIDATPGLLAASLVAGISWITVLTCLNVSAQTALPDWVRARGLAVYLMMFFGSLSLGSAFWGQVSSHASTTIALLSAAALLVVIIPFTWKAKLGRGDSLDLSPSLHWPTPSLPESKQEEGRDWGPVLTTVTYRIAEQDREQFLQALNALSHERYRDGAYDWGVTQDADDPRLWMEWFMTRSWHEHLRQHQRVTMSDKALQEEVRKFHRGDRPPIVEHVATTTEEGVKP